MKYLLMAAILPCYFLCNYINKHDINKEPKKLLYKVFAFGLLSVIPICIIEILLEDVFIVNENLSNLEIFINTFFGVALVEEFFKWLVVKSVVYDNKECDEVYDLIVYCVYSSIGFACFENILFVLENGYLNAFLRAVISVPSHACDGVIMGYLLGKVKLNNSKLYLILSLIIPSISHAIFDSLIEMTFKSSIYIIIFFVYVVFTFIISFKLVKMISNNNTRL